MGGSSSRTYRIQEGDTLYSLGQRYGFSTQEMLAANPGVVPENLQINQQVNIPQ